MRARRVRVVLYGSLHRLLFILFAVKGKMYATLSIGVQMLQQA